MAGKDCEQSSCHDKQRISNALDLLGLDLINKGALVSTNVPKSFNHHVYERLLLRFDTPALFHPEIFSDTLQVIPMWPFPINIEMIGLR